MRPFLFSIGSIQIPSFFFFIMVAALASTFYAVWVGKRNGLNPTVILDMGIIGMLSGVIGSRVFHILVEAPGYYWEKPLRVFEFWRGGFVSWGGFFAIGISLWVYFRRKKIPILPYLDVLAVAGPIIKFCIRVACLLVGCCYGKPTDLPWAITFTNPLSTAYYYYPDTPLHPSQVYSMIHAALLFVLINWVYRRRSFPGQTIAVMVMGWSLPRALIEFFRGDIDRGVYWGGTVSTGQIVGALTFLFGIVLYWQFKKLKNA